MIFIFSVSLVHEKVERKLTWSTISSRYASPPHTGHLGIGHRYGEDVLGRWAGGRYTARTVRILNAIVLSFRILVFLKKKIRDFAV